MGGVDTKKGGRKYQKNEGDNKKGEGDGDIKRGRKYQNKEEDI